MDPRSEEKRRQLERALEKGVVMVHLDARRPGVIVPAHLREDFHLRLNLSLRFDPPDLSLGEWGARQTLSFGGARFAVAVPWSAIFAITGAERSEQAWLYAEDMPKELFEEAARQFGLTGAEVEQLRDEARAIDRADPLPDPTAASLAPRRQALQVVRAASGEVEPPQRPGDQPAAARGKPESEPEPAAPDDKGKRRAHLRLVE